MPKSDWTPCNAGYLCDCQNETGDKAVAAYKVELAEKVRALGYYIVGVGDPAQTPVSVAIDEIKRFRAEVLRLIEDPTPSEGGEGRQPKCLCGRDVDPTGKYPRLDIVCPKHDGPWA